MRTKAPSKRPNDGMQSPAVSAAPFGRLLRSMATLIPNTPPQPRRPRKYKAGIGYQHAAKRRFTEAQVREFRRRHVAGEAVSAIARELEMADTPVRFMLTGISYAWVL